MKQGWTDLGRPGGTDIEFAAEGNVNLRCWFKSTDPEIMNRLCVFAKSGGDGSMAAFWLATTALRRLFIWGLVENGHSLCEAKA
jgi:hypothetical protein